ncbi:hypothetical protein SEA_SCOOBYDOOBYDOO_237 [Mycobacterium phage ScoobyDoobyDoo]|nr:hypothetical protein SEA_SCOOBYDOOBYDOO_237 [Mycobacterium phage ScoobyDoobyDoo]
MSTIKYVGRAPDSDGSLVPRRYVQDRYGTIKVDTDFITSEVLSQAGAAGLVTESYVDAQDNLRAKKAAVDAADANHVPVSQRGQANGVVPLDNNAYIPSQYLPTISTSRSPIFVPATSVALTSNRVVTTTNPKEYQAASISIPDPGYPYIPLLFAQILGGSSNGNIVNRTMGTGNFGQVTILRSDNEKYGWNLCGSHKPMYYHTAIPFADNTINPTVREPMSGASTFGLWLGLWSGLTYTFSPVGLNFFALVYPGF